MKKTVLVTGGLGYLGGRISRHLSEDPQIKIRITSRKNITKTSDWIRDLEVRQSDLVKDDLNELCEGVSAVIHLASVNEIISASDPELALVVNGLGTLRLLKAANQNGVSRFMYFSTAHVYGSPLKGKIGETSLPRPVHPYAISHKVAEDFVLAAHDRGDVSGIVIRLTNGYGAPATLDADRWSLLINDLCRQAVVDRRLVLKSSGMQKRNFISIYDICRVVSHFLRLKKEQTGDGLFNVGSEETRRIIDIAEIIADRCGLLLGYRPELSKAITAEDASDFSISIHKLKSTGFELEGDLQSGIDETLLFCKNNFS